MPFVLKDVKGKSAAAVDVILRAEMQRFETYLINLMRAPLYTAAPINPQEGDIVRADGTSWNPGSGRGFYGYDNGAWTFLG